MGLQTSFRTEQTSFLEQKSNFYVFDALSSETSSFDGPEWPECCPRGSGITQKGQVRVLRVATWCLHRASQGVGGGPALRSSLPGWPEAARGYTEGRV